MTKKKLDELMKLGDAALNKHVNIIDTIYDRRYKLDAKTKDIIRKEFVKGKTTMTKLANKYFVSPTTIARTVNEEFHIADNLGRKHRAYNTTAPSDYTHTLAEYKRELLKSGAKKLIIK